MAESLAIRKPTKHRTAALLFKNFKQDSQKDAFSVLSKTFFFLHFFYIFPPRSAKVTDFSPASWDGSPADQKATHIRSESRSQNQPPNASNFQLTVDKFYPSPPRFCISAIIFKNFSQNPLENAILGLYVRNTLNIRQDLWFLFRSLSFCGKTAKVNDLQTDRRKNLEDPRDILDCRL